MCLPDGLWVVVGGGGVAGLALIVQPFSVAVVVKTWAMEMR